MQHLLVFVLFFIGIGSSSIDNAPPIAEKVINKAIKKAFGVEEYSLQALTEFSKQELLAGSFSNIYNNENKLGIIYNGRVNSCRIGGCSAEGYEESVIDLDAEYFDYIVVYNLEQEIKFLKIYNYNATYGYEITSKAWLKQFLNYNGEESLKLNKQIDGISGATISADAMTNELQQKTALLKNFLENKLSNLSDN